MENDDTLTDLIPIVFWFEIHLALLSISICGDELPHAPLEERNDQPWWWCMAHHPNREASGSHRGVGACLADNNKRGNLKHKPRASWAAGWPMINVGRVI